jgi:hypothetical protein
MSRARRLVFGLVLTATTVLFLAVDGLAGGETPIVVRVEGGFRWADAAIGALAGVGISLATAGCVALVRLRGAGPPRQAEASVKGANDA